jgi:hypothetical protein
MSKPTRLTIPATLKTSLCEYVQSSEHKQHITGKQIQEWAFKQFGYVLPQSTISTVLGAHGISIKRDGGRGRPPIRNKNLTHPNNSISKTNGSSSNTKNNNNNNNNSGDASSSSNFNSNSSSSNSSSSISSSTSTSRISKRSTTNSRKTSASKSTTVALPQLTSASTNDNTTSVFYQQELMFLDAILLFLQTSMLQITPSFVSSLISAHGLDLQLLRAKYFLITTLYEFFDHPYNYRDLILKLASKYPALLSAVSISHNDNNHSQDFNHLPTSTTTAPSSMVNTATAGKQQTDFPLDSSLINNQLLDYWPETSFGLHPHFYNQSQSVPLPSHPVLPMQSVQHHGNSQNSSSFTNLQTPENFAYTDIPLDHHPKSYPPSNPLLQDNGGNGNHLLLQTPVYGSSNSINSLNSNLNII